MDPSRRHPSLTPDLHTPVYLKTQEDQELPCDLPAYYVLASDGLYLCRNHPFYRSSVRAPDWPSELAPHRASLHLNYPRLSQELIERVIGFFDWAGRELNSEAAVLLAWDEAARVVREIVPEQCGIVGRSFQGTVYPISLDYEVPTLPQGWKLIGDIHSHVDMPAFASSTDREDELHRPGLHLVVGRLDREPPEFHCEVTVDGQRFLVGDLERVLEGYQRRRREEVPAGWMSKVRTLPLEALYETANARS